MRDFFVCHAPPPSAACRPSRARHTSYLPRQSVLRRGCTRVLHIQTDKTVVAISYGRPARSSYGGSHEALAARVRRPPFWFTSPAHQRQLPDHTSREREGSALKHRSCIGIPWHQPRGRRCIIVCRRFVSGQCLMARNDTVSDIHVFPKPWRN